MKKSTWKSESVSHNIFFIYVLINLEKLLNCVKDIHKILVI